MKKYLLNPVEMLSNTCKYGIRALIYIASKSNNKDIIGIKQISDDLKLPMPFLAKILQQLVKNKILHSLKGPHGGYFFAKDPGKVTLYEIILILDGGGLFENCVIQNKTCKTADKENLLCPVHKEFYNIRKDIIKFFKRNTIFNLVESARGSMEIML